MKDIVPYTFYAWFSAEIKAIKTAYFYESEKSKLSNSGPLTYLLILVTYE